MVNRIVLGAFDNTFVLRASRPTFDVLSTGLTTNQLAFDSRWGEASNCFLIGSFTFGTASYVDVMFGETFALNSLPFVATHARIGSNQLGPAQYYETWSESGINVTAAARIQVFRDRVRFPKPVASPYSLTVTAITYMCFRNKAV